MHEVARILNDTLRRTKGFVNATYFTDEAIGEHGALILWDSKKNAKAARKIVFSKLKEAVNDILTNTIWFPLLKVVE